MLVMREIIQSALGISPGDVVWTSYGKPNDYEVISISQPLLWEKQSDIYIFSEPVISLVCRDLSRKTQTPSFLGNIRQIEDRWFSEMNDEIYVRKSTAPRLFQPDLFSATIIEQPGAYPFQSGVDYSQGAGLVWHCSGCRIDFNTEVKKSRPCICNCGSVAEAILYINFPKEIPTHHFPSAYLVGLNLADYAPGREIQN